MSTSFRPLPLLFSMALWIALGIFSAVPAHAGLGVWTPLGPGAGNGEVECVTVHPGSPGIVWACLPHGGLYRSVDRGATWMWTGQPFIGMWGVPSAVAADPSHPNTLWAATSTDIFRTEDGGLHWIQPAGSRYQDAVWGADPLQVLPVAGGPLYVASSKRLLVSPDNGATWNIVYAVNENSWVETFATDASRPGDLYLAGQEPSGPFFFRSSDAGNTWEDLTDRLAPVEGIHRLTATSTALYASVNGSRDGLFRSSDRGITWVDVLAGKPGVPAQAVAWTLDPRAPRTLYVAGLMDATSPRLALWVSRDEGETWTKAGTLPPIVPQHLTVDSAAGALYVGGPEGLARSLDGGATWKVVLHVPDRESSCAQISFQPDDPSRLDLTVG